jgi:hypothetical protein
MDVEYVYGVFGYINPAELWILPSAGASFAELSSTLNWKYLIPILHLVITLRLDT